MEPKNKWQTAKEAGLARIKQAREAAGKALAPVVEFAKTGVDSIRVKGLRTVYGNLMTQQELDELREADEQDNQKAIDELRKKLDARKKSQGQNAVQPTDQGQ